MLLNSSLDPESRESLERMLREAHRLVRMTNNLVLNAQLESFPALATEPVSLKTLMEEVAGDVRMAKANQADITVRAPEDVVVQGDYDLLKAMLLNLVDNAIKFTPSGGKVELALSRDGTEAIMTVSDTGRGIPEEDLPRVTEPFYKVRASSRSSGGGTGLGLAIVKQVARMHGGDIAIASRVGIGTKVRVRLPVTGRHRHWMAE